MIDPRPIFRFEQGMRVALLGPNGAGKSTMLREFLGVDVHHVIRKIPRLARVQCLGAIRPSWVSQRGDYPEELRVDEFWSWHQAFGLGEMREFQEACHVLGIEDSRRWGELSGGQQQYLRLRRSLSESVDVLVWDEPFQHLDAVFRREIMNHFLGWSALFSTHNTNEVRKLATHALIKTSLGWQFIDMKDPRAREELEAMDLL